MIAPTMRQKGFSLFIVMIIMLVIALLVVVTSQSASTEIRMSTNDADRKYALSMAESGLRDAESFIQSLADPANAGNNVFSYNCDNGLCLPLEQVNMGSDPSISLIRIQGTAQANGEVAWKRHFNNNKIIWDSSNNGKTRAGNNPNVRYIVEYLGQDDHGGWRHYTFRVTARAKGQNPNTVVMLQSVVELSV